jgi:hypothetical protein
MPFDLSKGILVEKNVIARSDSDTATPYPCMIAKLATGLPRDARNCMMRIITRTFSYS